MQEIKKRRIVLASVLKPVNDPRMFEKMGQTLSRQHEVHIIGTTGTVDNSNASIFFHPLAHYTRLGIDRILSPLRILKKLLSIKPHLIIIGTHELLWISLIAKLLLRCKVIYDVRENYFRNILYTNAFPPILRVFIALYVRSKEWITAPLINIFFLAEAGYEKELKFIGENKIIIENKVKKMALPDGRKWSSEDECIHFLFSGTLAETTGVFIAIDLASRLHAVDPKVRLHIIGFSPLLTVQHEINNLISGKNFIHFTVRHEPVPHLEILKAIQQSDVGIIAYPSNPSTENTIPTKLYEYLGYQLPILLIDHAPWVAICRPYHAAIPFNLKNIQAEAILRDLKSNTFYDQIPKDVFWEAEEVKLSGAVNAQWI
jgi:glycosyltransferase involved in cell wall biosynthesis